MPCFIRAIAQPAYVSSLRMNKSFETGSGFGRLPKGLERHSAHTRAAQKHTQHALQREDWHRNINIKSWILVDSHGYTKSFCFIVYIKYKSWCQPQKR